MFRGYKVKQYEKYKDQVVFSDRQLLCARISCMNSIEEIFDAILFLRDEKWYYFDKVRKIFKLTSDAPVEIVEYYNQFYTEEDLKNIHYWVSGNESRIRKRNLIFNMIQNLSKTWTDEEIIRVTIKLYYSEKIKYGVLITIFNLMGYDLNEDCKERIKDKKFNI